MSAGPPGERNRSRTPPPPRRPDADAGDVDPPWPDVPVADTPIWLSHHWPDEYDRCVRLRGRWVCRRCAVLYPVSLVAAVVIGAGLRWPARLDPWFLWLLPLPAVVEFIAEHLRLVRHAPTRLVVLTIPLAVATGRMYVRYLDRPGDRLVWTVVLAYGGACLVAGLLKSFRPVPPVS
ncbi:MAG: hypothetical protein HYX34_10170 [Actinobacteria bacterium]|nr:hypothetical protein [Actinomycetota bacterium]